MAAQILVSIVRDTAKEDGEVNPVKVLMNVFTM